MSVERWVPPAVIASAGDRQHVPYEGAPAWDGGAHCGGSSKPGRVALGAYLLRKFPGVKSIGGYSCRPNTANRAETSIHGTGRAIDVMVDERSSPRGEAVANWLVANAQALGVQYVIWNRVQWTASRPAGSKFRPYTAENPHTDHVHVELTAAAAMGRSPMIAAIVAGQDPLGSTTARVVKAGLGVVALAALWWWI